MGWGNVPDDWGSYYTRCDLCKTKYHMSEGGCCCTEDKTECAGDHHNEGLDAYFDDDDLIEIGKNKYCKEHAVCECCEKTHEDLKPFVDDPDLILCPNCWDDEHECGETHETISKD